MEFKLNNQPVEAENEKVIENDDQKSIQNMLKDRLKTIMKKNVVQLPKINSVSPVRDKKIQNSVLKYKLKENVKRHIEIEKITP